MGAKRVITDEIATYIRQHAGEMTVNELANILDIKYQTVYLFCRRENIVCKMDNVGRGRAWHGCDKTCPDFCPYEDCRMPARLAVMDYEHEFGIRDLFTRRPQRDE